MGRAEHAARRAARGVTGPRKSRAGTLTDGVNRLGRSRSAHKTGRWNHFRKGAQGKKVEEKKEVKLTPATSEGKWYAADDVNKPLPSRKSRHKITKLRKSITPGTILIILAGKYMGKRVVFLKQLPSGLLLVTGPYAANGVPLRRVNQAYVISTSTKVDVSTVDTKTVNDEFFKREAKEQTKGDEKKAIFDSKDEKGKVEPSAAKKAVQARVDTAVMEVVNKIPQLKRYLKTRFTLRKAQYPHLMKF